MDPDYRAYLNQIIHHLELEQSELENLDPDYVGEEEDEEEEEEEDEEEGEEEEEDDDEEEEETDEDEEEEEEEEEEEVDDERDGDNAGGVDVGGHSETASRQVLLDSRVNAVNSHMAEVINVDDSPTEDANEAAVEVECGCSTERVNNDDSTTASLKGNSEENEDFNRGEIDGLFCPICFEAWSSGGGDHHICCLPCGHIYGLSCIKKWLGRPGSSKCPQCKKKCGLKSIRLLYASRIVAVDGELQKTVKSLEAECASLKRKSTDWSKKEVNWKKTEADLRKEVRYLKERTHDLEDLLEDMKRRASVPSVDSTMGHNAEPNFHIQGCTSKFVIQKDFQIPGARLFDIDSSSKILVFARSLLGNGGAHLLTKVSLLSNHEREDIHLPVNTKIVKDLHVSPHAGLVLLASLGKKLSVLSTESNNTVLTYELPAAAWSCSWDMCSSNYVYAGLQNGTVLQLDMRQTVRPVESLAGLTNNPIHTLHSLSLDSSHSTGNRSVLTASSAGLCQWNFGASEERPNLIPESYREGVCISLAYCKSSDYIVASYRPKIEISGDLGVSQPMLTAPGQAAQGSHVLYRKMGNTYQKLGASCANVSDIRLPKSAIIDGLYQSPVFASGDESRCELVFQDLPSQRIVEHLKPQHYPIRDIKYNHISNSGILGCLSEDSFQLFTTKPL